MNPNWVRWVFASICQYFQDLCDTNSLPMYIEGMDRATNTLSDYIELRLDGPAGHLTTFWTLMFELDILVVSIRDENDLHKIQRNSGLVASFFANTIPVYKYGDGIDDDGTLLDCLQLVSDARGGVTISQFGQVETTAPIMQATVAARYKLVLI